jgi:hypothetical protein
MSQRRDIASDCVHSHPMDALLRHPFWCSFICDLSVAYGVDRPADCVRHGDWDEVDEEIGSGRWLLPARSDR